MQLHWKMYNNQLCFQQWFLNIDLHQNLVGNFLKVQRSRPCPISKSQRLYILLEHTNVGESLPDPVSTFNRITNQSPGSQVSTCWCPSKSDQCLTFHRGTKEISPMLNYNSGPEQTSSQSFCISSCICVLCTQRGSGIMFGSWLPRDTIYKKIRERKASHTKGKTKSKSGFLRSGDFCQLVKLTLQSQCCETLKFIAKNAVGISFSGDFRSSLNPLSGGV